MNILALKKELHNAIEKLEDEKMLLAIFKTLEKRSTALDYELSEEFQSQLNESMEEAEKGFTNTHEETMEWLKNRGNK